jgi:hypothetical protein
MTEKNRSEDVREALRRGDPAAGETGLSPAEAQAMRRAILTAVPAERRPFRLIPAFAAAAVAVLSLAVALGLWRAHEPQPVQPVQQTPPAPQVTPAPSVPSIPSAPAETPTAAIAGAAVQSPPAIHTPPRLHAIHHPAVRLAQARKPVHPAAEDTDETPTRQVQFSTPGGTRIIWLLPEKS